jgi:hypothetical protein
MDNLIAGAGRIGTECNCKPPRKVEKVVFMNGSGLLVTDIRMGDMFEVVEVEYLDGSNPRPVNVTLQKRKVR